MYKDGGLFSVTSRILIVDMLKGTIPVSLITGLVVLHAEEYVARAHRSAGIADRTAVQGQADFARSVHCPHLPAAEQGGSPAHARRTSKADVASAQLGFLKAFSDRPESFSFGLSPLQTTLMQLKLREVIIVPRCVSINHVACPH